MWSRHSTFALYNACREKCTMYVRACLSMCVCVCVCERERAHKCRKRVRMIASVSCWVERRRRNNASWRDSLHVFFLFRRWIERQQVNECNDAAQGNAAHDPSTTRINNNNKIRLFRHFCCRRFVFVVCFATARDWQDSEMRIGDVRVGWRQLIDTACGTPSIFLLL